MASGGTQEEPTVKELKDQDEMSEETFLKDLYLFMKKRDTPIDRIPHLGFKQIDLFVMYKTVKDLGGYHQVTTHQLWKQVYNTLGGNPRSTSAATCTRRHYEKLLLPYESFVKGGNLRAALPPLKRLHCDDLVQEGGVHRPMKRRLVPFARHHQPPHNISDAQLRVMSLPMHYPQYYHHHPSYPVLSPFGPMPPSVQGPPPRPVEGPQQPLEHLRYLAKQYKSSSGLMEPLNLSIRIPQEDFCESPASSFAPPSSSSTNKNPKFLNKPSPLYPACRDRTRDEGPCVKPDPDDARYPGAPPPYSSLSSREDSVLNLKTVPATLVTGSPPTTTAAASSLPAQHRRTPPGVPDPSASPKADSSPPGYSCWDKREEREQSPRWDPYGLSARLPSLKREDANGRKMEIQIPLPRTQRGHPIHRDPQDGSPQREKEATQSPASADGLMGLCDPYCPAPGYLRHPATPANFLKEIYGSVLAADFQRPRHRTQEEAFGRDPNGQGRPLPLRPRGSPPPVVRQDFWRSTQRAAQASGDSTRPSGEDAAGKLTNEEILKLKRIISCSP
ncbi:hypothetical protein NHX12_027144 [Muraenolepis orangiensis]|uniref:ARID domain-containing protein n=1 Tax=Muraenolepis orangiensis TaxID=630683 RepID=A0A9Q0INK8_9TELE|nr:hypothetical protein NHX12_027144 [Muraenolepis orangiensis]